MASRSRQRIRYRCNDTHHCGYRFSIKRQRKTRPDKCPMCGKGITCVEGQRLRELAKQDRCQCLQIPFPHRRGSILGCDHHPLPSEEWTDDQWEQFYGMLAVPRSG